jgi:hypothetical protein
MLPLGSPVKIRTVVLLQIFRLVGADAVQM